MKKTIVFAVMMAASLASMVKASDGPWPPASEYLPLPDNCEASDNAALCEDRKASWQSDYNGAISGEYEGQRNVAYCLSTGCRQFYGTKFRVNVTLGCAWRLVIVNSGHLKADESDGDNLTIFCGPEYLDDAGRAVAGTQARTLLKNLGIVARLP